MLRKMFFVLGIGILSFSAAAHNPDAVRFIKPVIKLLGGFSTSEVEMFDSLEELSKKPSPFDHHIEKHGRLYFKSWNKYERFIWLTCLADLTDAGATAALVEVAEKHDFIPEWENFALTINDLETQKKIRRIISHHNTRKYWQAKLETAPDGSCVLRLKDLRNNSECLFIAQNIKLPIEKLSVTLFNSDFAVRVDSKELFVVRRDFETDLWFETGSWLEVEKKTPAITTYREIRSAPVCTRIVKGKKVYRRFRIKEPSRKIKLGKLTSKDILTVSR